MTEVKPVLWVNSDDLNNRNFVGINAVKEGHMDLGRYYTIPLVSFDDHERAVKALRAENERLRRESEGRLAALHDKAEETKQEWMRAERAEAELAACRRDAERYRWVRENVGYTAWNEHDYATVTVGLNVPKKRGTCVATVTPEMLDAAIDQQLAQGEG